MFPSRTDRQRQWIITLGLLGILSGLAVVADPFPRDQIDTDQDERLMIATLRELGAAQHRFREACVLDTDGDGLGEFGFLGELAGSARLRADAFGNLSSSMLLEPELSLDFAAIRQSAATVHNYHVQVLLPGSAGGWVEETHDGGGAKSRIAADLAEQVFVAVAWPTHQTTSRRALYLTHQGQVLANLGQADQADLRGMDQRPEIDVDLPTRMMDAVSALTQNGRRWVVVRD